MPSNKQIKRIKDKNEKLKQFLLKKYMIQDNRKVDKRIPLDSERTNKHKEKLISFGKLFRFMNKDLI